MENIARIVGIEHRPLAFRASVLLITPPRLPYDTPYPHISVYVAPFLKVLCRLFTCTPEILFLLIGHLMFTIIYVQAMHLHMHIHDRYNSHTTHSFYKILVMEASVITCCRDSTLSTLLLLPFQLVVSFPPLKVLYPKIPEGEAGRLFNTLPPHADHVFEIDRVVTIETGAQHF